MDSSTDSCDDPQAEDVEQPAPQLTRLRHALHVLQETDRHLSKQPWHSDVLIKTCNGDYRTHSLLLASLSPMLGAYLLEVFSVGLDPFVLLAEAEVGVADLELFFAYLFNRARYQSRDLPALRRVCESLHIDRSHLPRSIFRRRQRRNNNNNQVVLSDKEVMSSLPSEDDDVVTAPEDDDKEEEGASLEDATQLVSGHTRLPKPPPSPCLFCRKVYKQNRNRNAHMLTKHPDECREKGLLHQCLFCSDVFVTRRSRQKHMDFMHSDPPPEDCGDQLDAPDENMAGGGDDPGPSAAEVLAEAAAAASLKPALPCLHCDGHSFPDLCSLRLHVRDVHPLSQMSCLMCGSEHDDARALFQHIQTHAGQPGNIFYTCKHCHANFSVRYDLHEHIKRVHLPRPDFVCQECGAAFHHAGFLSNHVVREHVDPVAAARRLLPCPHCDKKFKYKAQRDRHLRSHLGVKPYVCEVCGKRFVDCTRLRDHQTLHLDQEAFGCDLCGKKFYQRSSLLCHLRSEEHKQREVSQQVAEIVRDVNLAAAASSSSAATNMATTAMLMGEPASSSLA